MRTTLAVLVFVFCAIVLQAEERTKLSPVNFVKALNAKYRAADLQGILQSLDDDVIIFVADEQQPWKGKAIVEEKLRAFFADYRIVQSGEKDFHSREHGDLAFVAYLYETELEHAGQTLKTTGKETYVLQRDGDSWKVLHDHLSANR